MVAVSVAAPAKEGLANAELLDFMEKLLGVARSELQLARGWSVQTNFLIVSGMDAIDVFKRLKAAVETDASAVDPRALAAELGAGEFSGQAPVTAGAASFQARKAWEASEELEELAAAPGKKDQTFIK